MTAIDELWQALENYQPEANKSGHGKSWADMCKKKTFKSASFACYFAAAVNDVFAQNAIRDVQFLEEETKCNTAKIIN